MRAEAEGSGGQYAQAAEFGLLWYRARWYDPGLGRWAVFDRTQPDTVAPDSRGSAIGLDRYAFVANNPIKYVDPSGHCRGVASAIRGVPGYDTTCNNLDMALTIVTSDQTTVGQRLGASAYIVGEFGAHGLAIAGSVACLSNVAVCVAGAKTASGIGGATAEAACADGDPLNELQAIAKTAESVNDKHSRYVLNSDPGSAGYDKAKWFEQALGYTRENMASLSKQIVFDPNKAIQTKATEYGVQYNQWITKTGANGKIVDVKFAWLKLADGTINLVTAIPTKK